MGIFDLFFGSNDTTSFYQLYNKLKDWKKAGVYPSSYNFPKALSFPTDFWKRIITVHKSTLADGNERAMSVYWADGELVVSPIDIGDGMSVTSRGNISVKYSPHPTRKGYFRKEVILNSSVYKKVDVYHKKAPKKVEIEYLFNLHTHPQHKDDRGVGYYNFFSSQDIRSFIQSNVSVTGLITDKLWILIRSSNTPNDVNFLADTDVTLEKLKDLNIGVYSGEFYKKLERLPAPSTRTTSTTT